MALILSTLKGLKVNFPRKEWYYSFIMLTISLLPVFSICHCSGFALV